MCGYHYKIYNKINYKIIFDEMTDESETLLALEKAQNKQR